MARSFIKRILSRFGYAIIKTDEQARGTIPEGPASSPQTKAMCRSLLLQYQQLVIEKKPLPKFADIGFRVFSQCEEDGIILFLFSVVGTTNRVFVEVGAGNGVENNCANLAINLGWHGLFIDGSEENSRFGTDFYALHPDTRVFPPRFLLAKVDRNNINDLIRQAGFEGEIDFLSIDIDGMDYWIWKAIECVNARVVAIEANGKFGMRSITVPYDPNWVYDFAAHPHYHGASLPALTTLAGAKNYRLVGTNRFGYNAFYVRNDVAQDKLPAVSVESCRLHHTRKSDERIFSEISHLPFVEI
jgi:hypothetical protein